MVALRRGVFVDASAWYAVADTRDPQHPAAVRRLRSTVSERRLLCTTNHVASEAYTLIRYRLGASAAHTFLQRIHDATEVRRVFVLETWESEAETLLLQYSDQDFSYVDATSFVAMGHLGITQALTFDHHFLVAGFTLITG